MGIWPETSRRAGGQVDERAETLLLEHLDSKQARDWKEAGLFGVVGSKGTLYEINRDSFVYCGARQYCLQSYGWVPGADACLARKLLIETDEDEFLRRANLV
jgi:hypothetical protein